ncbi:GNAT family N-acetyltransferase [Pedobacter sp. KBW06]|uniref:GNAT family N-acetyltransferase n=1 Tax=Pedobacter sp. KBW06 TaxID=2153359 RepID=UPI000F5A93F9|nr:GNAT family N-acetyltransferase [Pedobacter sp. KBW06]RQO65961.1 GNAT family N-acetyltransferase [Pedobacter sp. KBW06]
MVEKVTGEEKETVKKLFIDNWNTDFMISNGKIHKIDHLESYLYKNEKGILGIITYCIENNEIEIVSLDSFAENKGIGTALVNTVVQKFKEGGFSRLWLITTNDNLHALKFYQRRNFTISKIHLDAVKKARNIKPSIPLYAENNISIEHEIELSYRS